MRYGHPAITNHIKMMLYTNENDLIQYSKKKLMVKIRHIMPFTDISDMHYMEAI